jgi:hypothetical protein
MMPPAYVAILALVLAALLFFGLARFVRPPLSPAPATFIQCTHCREYRPSADVHELWIPAISRDDRAWGREFAGYACRPGSGCRRSA